LLWGAFGVLVCSLPQDLFLGAANQYLLRLVWSEGFATAVHLALDLRTGAYEVRTAGHPPALQFHAGSGRWRAHWTDGPVLGLVPSPQYSVFEGKMQSGDALLLYTDGLVETPTRDITYGIDKLLGEAEKLVQHGFEGGADRLVQSVDSKNDDRALFLLHRR
jgi:serine phosphatase RsbU (regulator of sigma subunit)